MTRTTSIRLMTLAPGHFHAALCRSGWSPRHPPRLRLRPRSTPTPLAHLDRIAAFNARPDDPTDLGSGPPRRAGLARPLRSANSPATRSSSRGRNRPKIDLMRLAVARTACTSSPTSRGSSSSPTSRSSRGCSARPTLREVLAWDVMTERHEVTNLLQRELVRDRGVFGGWQAGTPEHPALVLESVHSPEEAVAGGRWCAPWWWFDPAISGEAMADVGTHLADLALWLIAPDQAGRLPTPMFRCSTPTAGRCC